LEKLTSGPGTFLGKAALAKTPRATSYRVGHAAPGKVCYGESPPTRLRTRFAGIWSTGRGSFEQPFRSSPPRRIPLRIRHPMRQRRSEGVYGVLGAKSGSGTYTSAKRLQELLRTAEGTSGLTVVKSRRYTRYTGPADSSPPCWQRS